VPLLFFHDAEISTYILVSLTLGLMGLDELHLRVLATSSEDLRQRKNAQKGTNGIINSSISIDFINSIEAHAEGKTLGPSGTPFLGLIQTLIFQLLTLVHKVLLLGNVVRVFFDT